jgi:hypothetical protein
MDREERKKIRQKIYEIYGWSLKEWAKRRGFSHWDVYNYLQGKIQGKRSKVAREIQKTLEEDLRKAA